MENKKLREDFFKLQKIFKNLKISQITKKAEFIDLNNYLNIKLKINNVKSNGGISFLKGNTVENSILLKNKDRPLILIFGSAYKPGGGVLNGAKAQEEDISRHSTFYFQVKDNNEFYGLNHKDYNYSDYALYVEKALMLTDIYNYELNEYKEVSFITIAAPNLSAFIKNKININEEDLYKIYKKRLRSFFYFAELKNYKEVIVGPWGCGVFGLSVEKTALIFKDILSEKIFSGNIIFSILNDEMFNTYKKIISNG